MDATMSATDVEEGGRMTHHHVSVLAEIACAACALQCAECHQPRALITDVCRDCYDREWDAQINAEADRFGGAA